MTRRHAIGTMAAGAAAVAAPSERRKPPICIFTKHMAQFGYDELGKKAKEIGFDGIDLTVRGKGHVLPENAARDLPRAADAIRSHGLELAMVTTEIKDASHPATRPILSTAAKMKAGYWKVGYLRSAAPTIDARIAEARATLTQLTALSKEYGIVAGYHNHSGDYFGGAVWDTRSAIEGLDPRWIGYYFDPAHATIEGGLSGWKSSLLVATPRLKMAALKDFIWAKGADGKWKVQWMPMGQGMVNWPAMFEAFAAAKFTGPLTLHVEYHAADELAAIANDYAFIRKHVDAAYK